MSGQVILLPRPAAARPEAQRLGLYLHVGRNHHTEVLACLAEGIRDYFGVIIDATYADRHKELIDAALSRNLDVVLDPLTHRSATVGGYSDAIAQLPWGRDRPHRLEDFDDDQGRAAAQQIVEFARSRRFTQILGPTHVLQGPNDPWLRRDIATMGFMRDALDSADGRKPQLLYSLAIPMDVLRDRVRRQAIVAALGDAPADAIWLKTENFGSDATGDKTAAYVEASGDFHPLGLPLVADQVGGLPGLGLMAYGAVGGMTCGITMLEGFKPAPWRRPREEGQSGGLPVRVYIPRLDLLLKPTEAAAFLKANSRVHSQFGCTDTHCCPKGVPDMLQHPARHFVYQRSRQVRELSGTPDALRPQVYLDNEVRRVSDDVASVAGFKSLTDDLRKSLATKQKKMARFRQAMAHLAESNPIKEPALAPKDRPSREREP